MFVRVGNTGMKSAGSLSLGTAALCLGLVSAIAAQAPAPKSQSPAAAKPPAVQATTPAVSHPQAPSSPAAASAADYNGLVKKYCAGCHSDRNKDRAGSLTLASFDIAKAGQEADVA